MRHPSPERLVRGFDELYGASMSARSGKHGDVQTVEFVMQLPSEKFLSGSSGLFGQAIKLYSQVMLEPYLEDGCFSEHAVQIEKKLHRQRIENIVNDKIAYASERCVEIMCGDEPYGIPRLGYAEDIDGITPQSLYRAYQSLLEKSPLHLYIVGLVDVDSVLAEVFSAFAKIALREDSQESLAYRGNLSTPVVPDKVKMVEEAFDVNQGKLNMGLRSQISYKDDEYPALIVYNGILGGFPHSKLFTNVREKASLAYYASSRLDGLKGLLFIQSGIQVADYQKAKDIIEKQLESIKKREISDDELSFTKTGLINQYLQSDDQPLTGAMMQMYARFSGRERQVSELIEQVKSISKEDIGQVADRVYLDTVYFLRDKGL